MTALLNVESVSHSYLRGIPVLHDVSLTVQPGEILGLVGPNGSGKSTLIRLVFDILQLQHGSIEIGGHGHASAAAKRDSIYLAGNDYVPDFLTGREYIELVARLYGQRHDPADIAEQFDRYGMHGRDTSLIEDYSHGMRKKVQFITALLSQRPLTVIDETLNGIDLDAQYRAESDIHSMRGRGGAFLICSHDLAFLERTADRILLLVNGRVVEQFAVTDIVARFGSVFDWTKTRIDALTE